MALEPAITDMEQLKDRPELAALLANHGTAVTAAKFDRNELHSSGSIASHCAKLARR